MTGIRHAATIRHLRYLARKAAADYAAHPEPQVTPTDEEKRTAVRAVLAGRVSQAEVARALDVPESTVGSWVQVERKRRAGK